MCSRVEEDVVERGGGDAVRLGRSVGVAVDTVGLPVGSVRLGGELLLVLGSV